MTKDSHDFKIAFTDDGLLKVDIGYLIQQLPREQQLALARAYSWESEIWAELLRGMLEEYSGENYNSRIHELRKLILTSAEAPDIFKRIIEDMMWHVMMAREREEWYRSRVSALQRWAQDHLRESHGQSFREWPEEVRESGHPTTVAPSQAARETATLMETHGLSEKHLESMKEQAYDRLLEAWESFKSRPNNVKDGLLVFPFRQYPTGFQASEIDLAFKYYRFTAPKPPQVVPAMRIAETIQAFENRLGGEGRNASGEDYNGLVERLKELIK